jgi:ABC-type branched-subunit amino acid transport system substrate-binding protein
MRRFLSHLLLTCVFATGSPLLGQTVEPTPKPYATLDRQAVAYRGPVGAPEKDFSAGVAVIGAILPLQGPQRAEGKALLSAMQMAFEEEQARGSLGDGRKLALAVRDESGPWGQASSEILKLIEQDCALVLLTSANGNTAHQAEQIANKISFPILTLASDPATTATNVPWVFRLGPSDADQARAFCRRIYVELGLRKVLLVAQKDHDGRAGGDEFEKAVRELKVAAPDLLEVSPADFNGETVGTAVRMKEPQAVVVWTGAGLAKELLAVLHKTRPSVPIFLCTKAAQLGTESPAEITSGADAPAKQNPGEFFTVASLPAKEEVARRDFEQRYQARTGSTPGNAAFQAYEGVHLIAAGLRAAGANRVLLRDYFASTGKFHEAAEVVLFDPAGNLIEEFAVVPLATLSVPSRIQ